MNFVDRGRVQCLRIAEAEQLCPAQIQRVEAGDAGSALRDGIRIVQRIVVEKIVAGDQSRTGVGVDTDGALVIAQRLIEGGGGKLNRGSIGRGDVLQEILR